MNHFCRIDNSVELLLRDESKLQGRVLQGQIMVEGFLLPNGCPASWRQQLAITSLTFMLNCVPLPRHPDVERKHVLVLANKNLVADLDDQILLVCGQAPSAARAREAQTRVKSRAKPILTIAETSYQICLMWPSSKISGRAPWRRQSTSWPAG